jgi:hypothetical protein
LRGSNKAKFRSRGERGIIKSSEKGNKEKDFGKDK